MLLRLDISTDKHFTISTNDLIGERITTAKVKLTETMLKTKQYSTEVIYEQRRNT